MKRVVREEAARLGLRQGPRVVGLWGCGFVVWGFVRLGGGEDGRWLVRMGGGEDGRARVVLFSLCWSIVRCGRGRFRAV